MDSIVNLFATGFGLGYSPWLPGTVGTLIGLPIAWYLLKLHWAKQLVIVLLMFALSIGLSTKASNNMGGGDLPQIVADEYLAFPIATLGQSTLRSPWGMAAAFVVFRVFDIAKPPPVSIADDIHSGFGIALDDALAALLAWIVLAIGVWRWKQEQIDLARLKQLHSNPLIRTNKEIRDV